MIQALEKKRKKVLLNVEDRTLTVRPQHTANVAPVTTSLAI